MPQVQELHTPYIYHQDHMIHQVRNAIVLRKFFGADESGDRKRAGWSSIGRSLGIFTLHCS
jgi:hypothetical protein